MNIKKKKKEAVGRLLYSRINTVTPALRVGAAEGSSSLFLPFLSRSFPPVLLRQPKQPPPALISKDLKKEKKENVFFSFLSFDVFMYRLRYEDDVCRDLRCQHSHRWRWWGVKKSKIPPKKCFKEKGEGCITTITNSTMCRRAQVLVE